MFCRKFAALVSATASVVLFSSCEYRGETGPTKDEPISIELGAIEHASVRLNIAAGELMIRGGAARLVQGRFEYNVASWKPVVTYSATGTNGDLTIRQPEHSSGFGNTHNLWDLEFNDKPLLDFGVECGAGKGKLDIGELNLQHVSVHIGAGEIDLDLRGNPAHDYDVDIEGGIGQATVHVPDKVGVRAEAHGGIGQISVSGLQKRDDRYENSLYGTSKVNVRLKVEGGIGEIRIIG
jgi:N-terminal domain of toast_rack, DUF2154/Cell wall-active antibiotics response LiaF, C-terminal